jgi:predicted PurR-regulated permease PerM
MDVNILQLVVICAIAWLCWWVNDMLNKVPILNTVIKVIIVVVAVLLVLQSLGLVSGGHISVH